MSKLDFLKADNFKLTKTLDLGRFNEQLSGQTLDVWLNLDRAWYADLVKMRMQSGENQKWIEEETARITALPDDEKEAAVNAMNYEAEARANEVNALAFSVWGRLWGCTPEEAGQIKAISQPLYQWCIETAMDFIAEYRGKQKNS